MNAKAISTTVHNVNKSLFWAEYCKDKTIKEVKEVEKYANFKLLKDNDLKEAIQSIKNFDINLVWDKNFWKLKEHESICAVASEIYNYIKRIKNNN